MPGYVHRLQSSDNRPSAEELLAEAGHPGGTALPELRLAAWESLAEVAGFVRDELAKVGVKVRVDVVPHGESGGSTDLCLQGWVADYPDPDGFFRGLLHGASWRIDPGPEIEAMLEKARLLQDQNARLEVFREIDRSLVLTRAVALPLAYPRRRVLRRPWLTHVWANSMSKVDLGDAVVENRP
jgi:ABC-type oligopeptide transport system substrate-binding subunit